MAFKLQRPTPLYQQIIDDIKLQIERGELAPGQKVLSNQKLAEYYGVSLITIKRAMAELIREGVLYAQQGDGTYVARAEPPDAIAKHRSIGLVLVDFAHPFFSLIMHGAEERAFEFNCNLLVANSGRHQEKEEIQIRRLRERGVDGLIVASLSHQYHPSPTIRKLHQDGFPYVMVSYIEDEDIYFVGSNHQKGAYIATQHLLELGYRRIGYLNGERGNLVGELRRKGYEQALRDFGVAVQKEFQFRLPYKGGEFDFKSGYEVGCEFVKMQPRPEAMFIYNDLAALGFQQALLEHAIRIPEDVAIVGYDNIERSQYAPVPLTTIDQRPSEIGKLALESVLKRIERRDVQIRQTIDPVLVVRQSCGAEIQKAHVGQH